MKEIRLLILLALFLCGAIAFAKNDKYNEQKIKELENLLKEKDDSIQKLNSELLGKYREIENYKKSMESSVEKPSLDLSEKVAYDLEIQQLKDSIFHLNFIIDNQKKEIASLDNVKLRYANGRLDFPYNAEKINDAKTMFNSVNEADKKKYHGLLDALNYYNEAVVEEVRQLIESLPYTGPKLTKFDGDKYAVWKNQTLNKIRSNNFYRKSKNDDFPISYLFNIVVEAEQRINKSKGPEDIPTFEDLIIRVNMK